MLPVSANVQGKDLNSLSGDELRNVSISVLSSLSFDCPAGAVWRDCRRTNSTQEGETERVTSVEQSRERTTGESSEVRGAMFLPNRVDSASHATATAAIHEFEASTRSRPWLPVSTP